MLELLISYGPERRKDAVRAGSAGYHRALKEKRLAFNSSLRLSGTADKSWHGSRLLHDHDGHYY
jgi:hypothetical protein